MDKLNYYEVEKVLDTFTNLRYDLSTGDFFRIEDWIQNDRDLALISEALQEYKRLKMLEFKIGGLG
jgi:hypothetical protein